MQNKKFKSMVSQIRKLISGAAFVLLIFALIAFLFLESSKSPIIVTVRSKTLDVITPVVKVLSAPFDKGQEYIQNTKDYLSLKTEVAYLREENNKLKEMERENRYLKERNEKLYSLLNYAYPKAVKYTAADVLTDSDGVFAQSLLVEAGESNGVEKGDAALFEGHLIGKVMYVGSNSSLIILLTDASSNIPVYVGKKKIKAILSGNNTEYPVLNKIENIQEIKKGDEIITSGIYDTLPHGLKIGKAAEDFNPLSEEIKVNLGVQKRYIDSVRIMNFGKKSILQDIKCLNIKP